MAGKITWDEKRLRDQLYKHLESSADEITGKFFREVDRFLPVENGHGHEAFGTALTSLGLPQAQAVGEQMLSKGSRDPKATAAGKASIRRGVAKIKIKVSANIPFLRTLEYGGIIDPISPGGHKEDSVDHQSGGFGPLYGGRLAKQARGTGFLMWWRGGAKYFAKVRGVEGYGFFAKAESAAGRLAARMGFTRK